MTDSNDSDEFEAFYNAVRQMDAKSLEALPNFIDLQKNHRSITHPLLQSSLKGARMQDDTVAIQAAFFRFSGHCLGGPHCQVNTAHPHSIQMPGVLEVHGFPGLYIYRKLFEWVDRELVDEVMHHGLCNPANETNLDAGYHVNYPQTPAGLARTASFFKQEPSSIVMQPRLKDDWVKWPLSSRDFIQKLRWVKFGQHDPSGERSLQSVRDLVRALIPVVKAESLDLQISGSDHCYSRADASSDSGPVLDISLGCSCIVIIGLERHPDPEPEPEQTPEQGGDSWLDFVDFSDDDDNDASANHESEAGSKQKEEPSSVKACSKMRLIALRLDSGDAILFSGQSTNTSFRVAQVLSGSMPRWEQNWPCTSRHPDALQSWKACMHGKRLDLCIR